MIEWPLNTVPREVQIAALTAAKGRRRFAFFLEIGTGKTQVILAEFEAIRQRGSSNILLVVCPNTLISVWEDEIRKVGINLPIHIKPKTFTEVLPHSIVIYNIESIPASLGDVIESIVLANDVYFALDESVTIKNFKSKRWRAMQAWAFVPSYTRILSGFPQVQNPLDYYPQLRLVGGDVPRSPYAFRNRYCRMGGYKGKVIMGAMNEEQLGKIISDVSFQAKKKDWLDLPEQIYMVREYELTAKQRKLYDDMLQKFIVSVNNNVITTEQAVHQVQKLQQIGSGFIHDDAGQIETIVEVKDNPKMKALKELLEQIDGKAIIFAHYRETIKTLVEATGGNFIRGGMCREDIAETIRRFNEDENNLPIICQLTSAKYGLTLLGTDKIPCHTSIYYENNYSLDSRVQSEGRNHRIGQHFPVTYIDMIGTPVDRRVIAALKAKKKMADMILDLAMGAARKAA